MADGVWNERLGRNKPGKFFFWQQDSASIIGEDLALGADEQHAAPPFLRQIWRENVRGRLFAAVIPGERDGRLRTSGRMLIAHNQPWRCGIGMNRRSVH